MTRNPRANVVAESVFLALARASSRLPHVRGKTRLLLAIYRMLKLNDRHIIVRAHLRRPVKFEAELDLHAWLQRLAFITGGYESETVDFLLQLHAGCKRKGYLLDVGANIGLIAIPFAKCARRDGFAVVAIEVVPDNIAVLEANVGLNELSTIIKIVPIGLGAVSETVAIQVEGDLRFGDGTGTANILPEASTFARVAQAIAVKTLDEAADTGEIPPGCSLMKIDTDGYDLKVLQGGVKFLARERPIIFGEFSQHFLAWHRQSAADVVSFAGIHGYQTWRRVGRHWKFRSFVDSTDPAFEQDLLLVPNELAEHFRGILDVESDH